MFWFGYWLKSWFRFCSCSGMLGGCDCMDRLVAPASGGVCESSYVMEFGKSAAEQPPSRVQVVSGCAGRFSCCSLVFCALVKAGNASTSGSTVHSTNSRQRVLRNVSRGPDIVPPSKGQAPSRAERYDLPFSCSVRNPLSNLHSSAPSRTGLSIARNGTPTQTASPPSLSSQTRS